MPPLPTLPVVLVVEDEALQRIHLAWVLEEAGFEVLEAANAHEALFLLNARADIRLLVTDVDMPGGMDGLSLSRLVRGRWPPVELLVVSGRYKLSEDDLPSRGRFLSKPYSENAVVSLARHLLADQ